MTIVKEFYKPDNIFELTGNIETDTGTVKVSAESEASVDGERKLYLKAHSQQGGPSLEVCLVFKEPCPELLETAYSWMKDAQVNIGMGIKAGLKAVFL